MFFSMVPLQRSLENVREDDPSSCLKTRDPLDEDAEFNAPRLSLEPRPHPLLL